MLPVFAGTQTEEGSARLKAVKQSETELAIKRDLDILIDQAMR